MITRIHLQSPERDRLHTTTFAMQPKKELEHEVEQPPWPQHNKDHKDHTQVPPRDKTANGAIKTAAQTKQIPINFSIPLNPEMEPYRFEKETSPLRWIHYLRWFVEIERMRRQPPDNLFFDDKSTKLNGLHQLDYRT